MRNKKCNKWLVIPILSLRYWGNLFRKYVENGKPCFKNGCKLGVLIGNAIFFLSSDIFRNFTQIFAD